MQKRYSGQPRWVGKRCRRGGRAAEGPALEKRYPVKNGIVGSNPTLSAISTVSYSLISPKFFGEMSELAEGARLEIVCAVKSGTEGSNPSLSAILKYPLLEGVVLG